MALAARAGRLVAGVLGLVAGRHGQHHAGVGQAQHGVVHRLAGAAAQRHVGHRRKGAVVRHPVDAGDHARVGAAPRAVEHAHGDQGHALGHAVGAAADGAGHVRAVAVAVDAGAARHGVVADRGAAAELRVAGQDAGVDDVRPHARAGGGVVVVAVERQGVLVDAVEAPGGAGLHRAGVHHLVLLDVGHARVGPQRVDLPGAQRGREALDGAGVLVGGARAYRRRHLRRRRAVVQHHDVLPLHALAGGRHAHRRQAVRRTGLLRRGGLLLVGAGCRRDGQRCQEYGCCSAHERSSGGWVVRARPWCRARAAACSGARRTESFAKAHRGPAPRVSGGGRSGQASACRGAALLLC